MNFSSIKKTPVLSVIALLLLTAACQSDPKPQNKPDTPPVKKERTKVPRFNRDSAYNFVARQVAFGPRVPNTPAHRQCKDWMADQLRAFGAEVMLQDFKARAYTGTVLEATNVIGRFNPAHPKRVVLAAHWDSRHVADYDPDESKQDQPILGADDGGSGVGVLLEVARLLGQNPIDLGVDIVLFDAEDHGEGQGEDHTTWCLGAQHWAKNPHVGDYKAQFGILLDMVGAKGARFTKEEVSMNYAPNVMNKVWKLAQNMGYGNYFVDDPMRAVIDDHLFVNQLARIPMIDIINRPANTQTGFVAHWHTHRDNMDVIHKGTLRAVGQTVLAVLYRYSDGSFDLMTISRFYL